LLGNGGHHNDWYDEECQIANENNNKAYGLMQHTSYTTACVEDNRAVRNLRRNRLYENNKVEAINA
jgi:hypothetical protein